MLVEQGLGKYCDPDFIRYTSREMQEALNMTTEEMDMAAHQLMNQSRRNDGRPALDRENINSNSPQQRLQFQPNKM